jgi:protease IV
MTSPAPRRSRRPLWLLLAILVLPVAMCAPFMVGFGGFSTPAVGDAVIVELDLEAPVVEGAAVGLQFGDAPMTTRALVLGLRAAAKDPRVKALYARVGGQGHGLATAMEIRDAVLAFRASGKKAIAFSESFGELSPGTGGYYVATAFDEIWLQPRGAVSLAPLSAEGMFAKEALAKVGVEPQIAARKEFKNAPNTFTEQGFTAPHREATLALLASAQQTLVDGIAASRPAIGDAAAVRALLARGPLTAQEALNAHLVDHLGHKDAVLAALRSSVGAEASLLWLQRYLERSAKPATGGTVVAVVSAVGQIHRGPSNVDPLSGGQSAGSDTIAAALRQAVADDDVKGIVLRIDSPGGSVVASETIAHEVERARAAGKPVVASMANVAGSGGYYIAMNADTIVAQPGTITGSIGVYAGKAVTSGAFEKIGVNFDTVVVDDVDASFFSTDLPYSEAARARLDVIVDDIYTGFVADVAKGRKKTVEEIEPVARGRIWSGSDAKARHLVDELGGWTTAFAAMRRHLSLAEDAPLRLQDFPARKPPFAELLAMLGNRPGDSSEDEGTEVGMTHRPVIDVFAIAARLRDTPAVQVLSPRLEVLP